MAENTPVPLNRTERVLSFMVAGVVLVSIVAFVAIIIAGGAHVDIRSGAWPVVLVLPGIGLPIAFLLIVAFLIVAVVRRRRIARDGGE